MLEGHSKIGKTTQALKIYYDRCKDDKPTIFLSLKKKGTYISLKREIKKLFNIPNKVSDYEFFEALRILGKKK